MFNIGDVVKIVNNGMTYSTYGTWIDKNCKEYKNIMYQKHHLIMVIMV